jgi:plastocyanin
MRLHVLIAIAAVALTAACSSSSSPAAPSSGTGTTVSIVAGSSTLTTTAYSPNPVTVAAGTMVTWTNNDSTSHTSTADGGAWSSPTLGPGQSFSATMSTRGTFTYHCTIHPGMVGTVTVQ